MYLLNYFWMHNALVKKIMFLFCAGSIFPVSMAISYQKVQLSLLDGKITILSSVAKSNPFKTSISFDKYYFICQLGKHILEVFMRNNIFWLFLDYSTPVHLINSEISVALRKLSCVLFPQEHYMTLIDFPGNIQIRSSTS